MNQSLTCQNSNNTSHQILNAEVNTYDPTQQLSANMFPTSVQTFAAEGNYKPQRTPNISDYNNSSVNPSVGLDQNQQYIAHESTNDGQKTELCVTASLSSSVSQVTHENTNTAQYVPSRHGQDFTYKLSKSTSLCADYETVRGVQGAANVSTMPLVAQDLNVVHDVPLAYALSPKHSQCYTTKTSRAPGAVFQGLPKVAAASLSARALLLPLVTRHDQTASVADVASNVPPSPSRTPKTLQSGGSISDYPSPQVSDLGSTDTHASLNQQSFAQSYASLTPWTSKLTVPGYVPLPQPAPDAFPFPLEHSAKKHILLSMPNTAQEVRAESWNTRPYIYNHLKPSMALKCYDQTLANSKTRNGIYHQTRQAQKTAFKMAANKEYRFRRTAEALQKSGLWEVAMKTGSLIKRNRELQKELEEFRSDAVVFLKSVIKNPQNRDFIKNVLNSALTSSSVPRSGSSVMTVVVSAAAAAAASVRFDSRGSSDSCSSEDAST